MYHRYNCQQYPFIFLNVKTARSEVDVNLTPDKRQLLIHNEQLLLLAIKRSLLKTYGNVPATYKVNNLSIASMLQQEKNESLKNAIKDKITHNSDEESADEEYKLPKSTMENFVAALKEYSGGVVKQLGKKRKYVEEIDIHTQQLQKIQRILREEKPSKNYLSEEDSDNDTQIEDSPMRIKSIISETIPQNSPNYRLKCLEFKKNELKISDDKLDELDIHIFNDTNANEDEVDIISNNSKAESPIFELDGNLDSDASLSGACVAAKWCITMPEIEQNVKKEQQIRQNQQDKNKLQRLRFKSEIKPSQNNTAEAELQKEIDKEDFPRMQILGQFNLGFIIVLLDGDLFIVDQHASDEKYNFEMLQRDTVLEYQKLAVPQILDLTAVNEIVLMQHLPIFERNGFKFEINENASTTKKVRLLGKPFSKNWQFGKEDIDELIFMLQDVPEGTDCRPSRIRDMFASRACRKSVMIGKALTKTAMSNVIRHMGEIEQPWNCPHGRPTMRHLINLDMLMEKEEKNEI